MVVKNKDNNECGIYEIKLSSKILFNDQAKNVLNKYKTVLFKQNEGQIVSKNVLYLGKDEDSIQGINYKNVVNLLLDCTNKNFNPVYNSY